MEIIELIKVIILGIVEGITEWLPISSTGHMILVDEFIKLNVSADFLEMFLVVIQLGAILAVVVLYWKKLIPFDYKNRWRIKKDTFSMWFKIIFACLPAAVVGLLFDDQLNELFYNPLTVAIALIVFGVLFIFIENYNKGKETKINSLSEITYNTALIIGIFQLIAAVFPGTSRSGATIVGALLIGVSRTVAAEFRKRLLLLRIRKNIIISKGMMLRLRRCTIRYTMIRRRWKERKKSSGHWKALWLR